MIKLTKGEYKEMHDKPSGPFTSAPAARRPSDETYAKIGWTLIAIIAFILVYEVVIFRFLPLPNAIGFRVFVLLVLAFNLLWLRLADRRFARHVVSQRKSYALRIGTLAASLVLNAPLLYMLYSGRRPGFLTDSPGWYSAAIMIWHVGLVTLMPLIALVRLMVLGIFALWARRRARVVPVKTTAIVHENIVKVDPSRRALLQTAVATIPMLALGGCTAAARRQEGSVVINRRSLQAPWLPDRLRGLTITQISDLHVGSYFRPAMLPRLIDTVNKLDSDILVVTGDLINDSNCVLPSTIEAIQQMKHRYGCFVCIGNHDQFDDRSEFVDYTRERLPLLINEFRPLNIGGERLTIGGLDYAKDHDEKRSGHRHHVDALLYKYDAAQHGPMIALAHHPHAFDPLAQRGIPLTLAGHTHGGQFMFTPPDCRPDLGLGTLLFRYTRGLYNTGPAQLFVNRGVGNWFPLRFNAPAEVVQLRLV